MYYIILVGLVLLTCIAVFIGNIVAITKKKQPYNGRTLARVEKIHIQVTSTSQGVRVPNLMLTYTYAVGDQKYTCVESLANRQNINVIGCTMPEAGLRLGLPIGSQIEIQYLESNPAKSCFDAAWVRTTNNIGNVMGIVLGGLMGIICLCFEALLIFWECI